MTQALSGAVVLYLGLVAFLAVAAALGAPLERAAQTGVVVAEVMLVVQAILDVAQMLNGGPTGEPAVHLGYVAVSVLLLPMLVRPFEPDTAPTVRRGRQVVIALACLVMIVVVFRQRSTA